MGCEVIDCINDMDSLISFLGTLPKTIAHGGHYGCDVDATIITVSNMQAYQAMEYEFRKDRYIMAVKNKEDAMPTHVRQVKELLKKMVVAGGKVCLVRVMPEIRALEDNVDVRIYTRLQFGDPGKVIDPKVAEEAL